MSGDPKVRPAYAVASVDNALRMATILQLEGELSVSGAADRLGVARSTAHRLLQMLVYRDFAVPTETHTYGPGPVLELAAHSRSTASRLRAVGLGHLADLVGVLDEAANLVVRTGDQARFVATAECTRSLRVGSREGMVFPAHRVSAGLVLLADLPADALAELYAPDRYTERPAERPDPDELASDLAAIRHNGFAVNDGRSERGVYAVAVGVHDPAGTLVAGLSVAMPRVRHEPRRLHRIVATLGATARAITADLAAERG